MCAGGRRGPAPGDRRPSGYDSGAARSSYGGGGGVGRNGIYGAPPAHVSYGTSVICSLLPTLSSLLLLSRVCTP